MNSLELGKKLFAHLEEIAPEIKHYFGILSIFGGIKLSETKNDPELRAHMIELLEKFPEQIHHDTYNFPSYTIGGIARAYALFKGYMTDEKTKAYVREYAEEMMTAPRNRDGIMKGPWPEVPRNVIWIDNAMAITPFLLYAGLALNEPRFVDEAAKQTLMMYDVFRDPANGLLHQSLDEIAAGVMTQDHWGRGNGWGYIALTELLQYLPLDHPERRRVEEYFGRHSYAMLMCQNEHGVWRQELPDADSYEEATATGLILYGFGVGIQLDYLNKDAFGEPYALGLQGLHRFINDRYQVTGVCPGCRTPGSGKLKGSLFAYKNRFPVTDDLHGFGPMLLALSGGES